jgi:hypothetical protein
MSTAQLLFAEVLCGSDVSHVPCQEVCSAHAQPDVEPFSPEVTKSRDRKRPCPEVALRMTRFSRVFFP